MEEIKEKYLPIGTVVMLKGGTKRVMITGFCSMPTEDETQMYDYAGCMFPEGFLSSDQTALFNHEQIEKVYHMGLEDDEEKTFKEQLKLLVSKMEEAKGQDKAEPKLEDIPPIGPGLPGYVAPATESKEEKKEDVKLEDIPPIGPGLPGYVAPQVNTEENKTDKKDELKFDENGVVVAEYKFDEE